MLTDTLCDIVEEDPGAFVHVVKDEDGALISLFIQTSRMRSNVVKYGLVLLFDHTYKINKNRLPVGLFKVMDGNGTGRTAGISYVVNEEKVTLEGVASALNESIGEEVANRIRTVVIDKDYSEAGAIRNVFPEAEVQLCDFHVAQTFKSRTGKEDPRVMPILTDLRYCENDDTFNALCLELKDVASDKFWQYFEKNWINCSLAWSFRDKKRSPNLGNTTNNRLENFNGKIKQVKKISY